MSILQAGAQRRDWRSKSIIHSFNSNFALVLFSSRLARAFLYARACLHIRCDVQSIAALCTERGEKLVWGTHGAQARNEALGVLVAASEPFLRFDR